MVARTPPKQQHKIRMVAPLNPTLLRETINKVDKCMARLQELQYTVAGGNKVVSGVTLSPRSTRGYLRTSLRCKQEFLRNKNVNARRSPPGKLPSNSGDWRRMSLPAMLLGETVGEILQASQFTKAIAEAVAPMSQRFGSDDPKTPLTQRRKHKPSPENSELRSRRKREKQMALQTIRSESDRTPSLQRAKSRINFKVSPVHKKEAEKENWRYMANRVSPRHRPWAKKTVLFPNPLFHSSPTSQQQQFSKTKSPVIARKHPTPHKFLIKSPVKIRNPPLSLSPTRAGSLSKRSTNVISSSTAAKLRRSFSPSRLTSRLIKSPVKIRNPPLSLSPTRAGSLSKKSTNAASSSSTAAKLRRSFSPSRLASRLVSPLKSRKSVQKSDDERMLNMMSGLKQRPNSTTMRFSAPRI